MSVLVCFHAHPDDEVFTTGGVMRLAADAGHRVVVVTATDGALGECPDGVLAPGESLSARRRAEVEASVDILGAQRLVMMGYADSGMAGTAHNGHPDAFANTDVEQVARELAAVLAEEHADVLTVYDPFGNYGHPDHIQVHRVGVRAAALAQVPHVYEATANRDHFRAMMSLNPEWAQNAPDLDTIGLSAEELTTAVDVRAAIAAKRAAMGVYASQVGDFGPFLELPPEALSAAFGTEWFRKRGRFGKGYAPAGLAETALALA